MEKRPEFEPDYIIEGVVIHPVIMWILIVLFIGVIGVSFSGCHYRWYYKHQTELCKCDTVIVREIVVEKYHDPFWYNPMPSFPIPAPEWWFNKPPGFYGYPIPLIPSETLPIIYPNKEDTDTGINYIDSLICDTLYIEKLFPIIIDTLYLEKRNFWIE